MSVFKVKIPQAPSSMEVRVNIPQRNQIQLPDAPKTIWAVGGGKGGIGKTLLTSNMAVYLSWLNKRVVVVDMDLGGSNLHTSLGVEAPSKTLNDLLLGKTEDVNELLQSTPIRNLQLISGAQDATAMTNLSHTHKARLSRKLHELNADFVLLDLGAGTSNSTLDFFLMADRKIVVVTPEPTSIENAYRFIKSAFYRMLRSSSSTPHVRQLIEQAMDAKNSRGIRTPKELLNEVKRLSPPDGLELEQRMHEFQIGLIVNQVRVKAEADIGKSILMVCERYFGMSVQYMGHLPYDSAVWQSIRRRVPFLIDAPNSTAVTHLEGILRNLLKLQGSKP